MPIRRRLAARVSLPLLLALALGCARDATGDPAPTAPPAPTQTPLPTVAPTPLAVAGPGVTPCSVNGFGTSENWQLAHHVRWSPDGSGILFDFSVGKSGTTPVGLYGVDADGHRVREIVNPIENSAFSDFFGRYTGSMMYFDISPDGSRVAYSSCRYSTSSNFELMVSDLDGTETRRLTENSHVDNYPVWSPDGARIAFISSRSEERDHDPTNYRLYTMAADGSEVRLVGPSVADSSFAAGPHTPSWSRDGRRIAFVVYEYDGNWEVGRSVYAVGADGSDPVKVADLFDSNFELDSLFGYSGGDFEPLWLGSLSWSPDGAMILFESSGVRVSVEESFVYYSLLVSSVSGDERGPPIQGISAWSPDGSRIAVQPAGVHDRNRELRDRSVVLYTVDGDGTDARVLARSVRTAEGYAGVTPETPIRRPADADACSGGRAVAEPDSNPELVDDCR